MAKQEGAKLEEKHAKRLTDLRSIFGDKFVSGETPISPEDSIIFFAKEVLSPSAFKIVYSHVVEELPFSEIAQHLEMDVRTVQSQYRRAIKVLRSHAGFDEHDSTGSRIRTTTLATIVGMLGSIIVSFVSSNLLSPIYLTITLIAVSLVIIVAIVVFLIKLQMKNKKKMVNKLKVSEKKLFEGINNKISSLLKQEVVS